MDIKGAYIAGEYVQLTSDEFILDCIDVLTLRCFKRWKRRRYMNGYPIGLTQTVSAVRVGSLGGLMYEVVED